MATTVNIGPASGGAGTGTLVLQLTYNFTVGSSLAVDYNINNAQSPVQIQVIDLANGFQAVTVPAIGGSNKAQGVIIIPPTSNTQTITLKGVTGDQGVSLSKTAPTALVFGTAPATIGITTDGTIAGTKFAWF